MTVQEIIERQNEYCGVTAWHNKGYTGKGVVVWNMENPNSDHSIGTTKRVLESAPNATVITTGYSMASSATKIAYEHVDYQGVRYSIEAFIDIFHIRVLTRSVGDSFVNRSNAAHAFWKNLQEKYNLVIFNSCGNEGNVQNDDIDDVAILVGACTLNSDGKPQRAMYSSTGAVDFTDFVGFSSGTSFASPYLAGKAALLIERFNGITQTEVYDYFISHSEDMNVQGEDTYTGWGLPIMGDPTRIIKIGIGKGYMMVDGNLVPLEQPAMVDKVTNRTLVPIRAIAEALGYTVEWDQATQTVTIKG